MKNQITLNEYAIKWTDDTLLDADQWLAYARFNNDHFINVSYVQAVKF